MTKEEFDNYKFGINTEINYFEDKWDRIIAVDFEYRTIAVIRDGIEVVDYTEVKGIREANA